MGYRIGASCVAVLLYRVEDYNATKTALKYNPLVRKKAILSPVDILPGSPGRDILEYIVASWSSKPADTCDRGE